MKRKPGPQPYWNSSTKCMENMMKALGPMTHLGAQMCWGVSLAFCLSSSEALMSEIVFLNLHISSKPKLIFSSCPLPCLLEPGLSVEEAAITPSEDLNGRKAFAPYMGWPVWLGVCSMDSCCETQRLYEMSWRNSLLILPLAIWLHGSNLIFPILSSSTPIKLSNKPPLLLSNSCLTIPCI